MYEWERERQAIEHESKGGASSIRAMCVKGSECGCRIVHVKLAPSSTACGSCGCPTPTSSSAKTQLAGCISPASLF
jgi:hypothetical protein